MRHRLGKGWLLGHILATADHFHSEPRYLQLLMSRRVYFGELGDRRHLPQQPQRIETTLLQCAGRPRQLRSPADLALDLADELSDFAARGFGLLALNADQRSLLFLIGKVNVEHRVGDEYEAHYSDEQHDIFNEQSAAHHRSAARRNGHGRAGRWRSN